MCAVQWDSLASLTLPALTITTTPTRTHIIVRTLVDTRRNIPEASRVRPSNKPTHTLCPWLGLTASQILKTCVCVCGGLTGKQELLLPWEQTHSTIDVVIGDSYHCQPISFFPGDCVTWDTRKEGRGLRQPAIKFHRLQNPRTRSNQTQYKQTWSSQTWFYSWCRTCSR